MFMASSCFAQQHIYRSPIKQNSIGMVAASFGLEIKGDPQFYNWLNENGIQTKSSSSLSLGFMLLQGKGKITYGFEGRGSFGKDPNFSSYSAILLIGKRFALKEINLLPILGIGVNDNSFNFSNTLIPAYLKPLKVTTPILTENEFLLNPRLLIFKTWGKLIYGFELGIKTTFFPSKWVYGDYGRVDGITPASAYNPYFSIFMGVGKWN